MYKFYIDIDEFLNSFDTYPGEYDHEDEYSNTCASIVLHKIDGVENDLTDDPKLSIACDILPESFAQIDAFNDILDKEGFEGLSTIDSILRDHCEQVIAEDGYKKFFKDYEGENGEIMIDEVWKDDFFELLDNDEIEFV